MKFFAILTVFLSLISVFSSTNSVADSAVDTANGSRIAEPNLADYQIAERTPGFSPITDIVSADGN